MTNNVSKERRATTSAEATAQMKICNSASNNSRSNPTLSSRNSWKKKLAKEITFILGYLCNQHLSKSERATSCRILQSSIRRYFKIRDYRVQL